ncbi:hypothetical protein AB3R30_25505 [Leptolyngbyaceae cyanobacterium UHCC 1019]
MNTIDQQDKIIYGVLGLSFLALLLFKSGDLIQDINAQSLVSRNASVAAKDSRIAEKRFGNCNTGFVLADGTPNLIEGETALDIRSRTPLGKGSILCDETGATAIVDRQGTISDIRVSATVRKAYQQQAFRNENQKAKGDN